MGSPPPLNAIPPRFTNQFGPDSLDENSGSGSGSSNTPDALDTGTVFDILVVYSTAAKNNEGGTNAMLALINQGIADTNVALQSSNIDLSVRLVGTTEYAYTTTAAQTALNNIRSSTDNILDEVHDLRDDVAADFVSFWTPLSDACGIASLITTLSVGQEYRAFGVCDPDCQFQYTFTHELGHNWGCAHAVGDSTTTRGRGIHDYSHGWRFFGTNGPQYRTIMAYSPGTRIRQFSDPGVIYQGIATGRSNLEDNARTIDEIKAVMSQFRIRNGDDHGNTTTTATPIGMGDVVSGNLNDSSDVDVFRIVLDVDRDIMAESQGSTDTTARLLDSSGTQITTNSDSGNGSNFRIWQSLTAGTYYLEVSGQSGATGNYSVQVTTAGDDHGNSTGSASVAPVPGTIAGQLEQGGDEDFFRLVVSVPGTLQVQTTGSTDTYGYLLDDTGTPIEADDDDGAGSNFSITRTLTETGTYYVRIRGHDSLTTGSYILNVSFTPAPDDHGNVFAEATPVTPGTLASPSVTPGEIETMTDVDVFQFTLFAGTSGSDALDTETINFDSNAPGSGALQTIISRQEGSYSINAAAGSNMWFTGPNYSNSTTYFADNGTPHIKLLGGDTFELTRTDGGSFSVTRIDLAEWSTVSHSAKSISWTGHLSGGSTVTHTFTTDGVLDGPGGQDDFETFEFPATFNDIVKLEANTTAFALDNIIVDDAGGGGGGGGGSGTTTTVEWEGPPTVPSGSFVYPTSYDEDGFHFRLTDDSAMTRTGANNSNRPDNGTSFLSLLFGDTLEVTQIDGSVFDVTSVDHAEYSTVFNSPQQMTWTGYKPDGSSVTHTFTTDGTIDGPGGQEDFETFTFPSYFTGLNRLVIARPSALDNLVFSTNDGISQSGTLQIFSSGTTDTTATLYDSAFSVITADDDSGSGSNFLINQSDFSVGTYYLRLEESGSNDTGPYQLHLGWDLLLPITDPPTGLSATNDDDGGVQLTWDSSTGATSYHLYRHTTNDFASSTRIADGVTALSYLDSTSIVGTNYYFWVTAVNSGGESGASDPAQGQRIHPGPSIIAQPIDTAVPPGSNATLNVTATTTVGTLSYQWYEGGPGNTSSPVGSNSNQLTVANVTSPRSFWVRTSNGFNHTDSTGASVSVRLDPPTLVSAFRDFSTTAISIRWNPVNGAAGYRVYRNTSNHSSGAVLIGSSDRTSLDDTSAVAGQDYYYLFLGSGRLEQRGNGQPGTALFFTGRRRAHSSPGAQRPGLFPGWLEALPLREFGLARTIQPFLSLPGKLGPS